MRYATAAAFRQALDDRLKAEAANTGLGLTRLRKRVAFELFLRRLVEVAPDRWVLKGASPKNAARSAGFTYPRSLRARPDNLYPHGSLVTTSFD
jgi:hypothetical protein